MLDCYLNRSKRLTDTESTATKIKITKTTTLRQNDFSTKTSEERNADRASVKEETKPIAKAYLPYFKRTIERVGRILKKHNIETTLTTSRKISQMFPTAKTKIEAKGVMNLHLKIMSGATWDKLKVETQRTTRNTGTATDIHIQLL